jgi:hypothetical protein
MSAPDSLPYYSLPFGPVCPGLVPTHEVPREKKKNILGIRRDEKVMKEVNET